MARRRRIEAPSAEELARIADEATRDGFAAKPPIAQIAGEAATLAEPEDAATRAERARNATDAETLRRARAEGWAVAELPVEAIDVDLLTRDRMVLEPEAMEELRASLRENGLRMPIEVMAAGDGRYELISGLRRLTAMRDVAGQGGTIRAFVRPAADAAARVVAMVEENEVRANLTPYERGRAAVSAVESGAFATLEEAVDRIFAAASKAKRSKVRSFALIHETLGDLMAFPQSLTERQGLKLAGAIRGGFGEALRQALAAGQGADASAEWAVLEEAMTPVGDRAPEPPVRKPGKEKPSKRGRIALGDGLTIWHEVDAEGHSIRLEGPNATTALVEALLSEIEAALKQR